MVTKNNKIKLKKTHIGIALLVVLSLFLLVRPTVGSYEALENYEGTVEFHKSMSCGCCGSHANYLKSAGKLKLDIMIMDDVDPAKDELNIPEDLRTCHTVIIGNYYVEGHVPLEAINRLMEEQPGIAGIALPGMPAGSPGMPGTKNSDWVIYSVDYDGNVEEWMVI